MDANGDGKVSQDEARKHFDSLEGLDTSAAAKNDPQESKEMADALALIKQHYDEIDSNGDNGLSNEELLGAKSKLPGALLMVCAVAGAVLGGTLVAVFMVLAFIGGLLATIGTKKQPATAGA